MSFVWEFIGVWKEQYFAMIRIQFPEFFRSAILVVYGFVSSLPISKNQRDGNIPEKSFDEKDNTVDRVECEVLYEPPGGTRSADVIIIHGLHGSTYKTWRQGVYECSKIEKVPLRRSLSSKSKLNPSITCPKCKSSKKTQQNKRHNKNNKENHDSKNIEEDFMNVKQTKNNMYSKNVQDILRNNISYDSSEKNSYDSSYLQDKVHIFKRVLSYDKKENNNISHNGTSELSVEFDNKFSQLTSDKNLNRLNKALPNDNCDSKVDNKFSLLGFYFNMRNSAKICDMKNESHTSFKNTLNTYEDMTDESQSNPSCVCLEEKDNVQENFETHSYEEYIKYCDVYGNYPLLLRECHFFLKFALSFAKEMVSLYKRLWNVSNEKELSPCWPRDWLPIDCPQARVISINYTTFLWMPIWTKPCNRASLQEKSLEMARQLEKLGVGNKPIVWAAHSKGGLFIKQIFINSWRGYEGVSRNIFINTHSLLFYSVPQHGSVLAHFFTPPLVKPSIEIVEIRTGSQMVQRLQNEFREAVQAAHEHRDTNSTPLVVSYTETIPTSMSGILLQIVFPTSADPGVGELYGIPLDHRMICKFSSRNSVLYKDFIKIIETACEKTST